MAAQTLSDVFVEQIEDLYSAETELVDALPRVAAAATDDRLRETLVNHLEPTRGRVVRQEPAGRDVRRGERRRQPLTKIATGGLLKSGLNAGANLQ